MTNSIVKFNTPRIALNVPDWPIAGHRGLCRFRILRDSEGRERAEKRILQSRYSPWAEKVRIVDGDDGKTWIIGRKNSDCVFMMNNRMRTITFIFSSQSKQFIEIEKVLECS